MSDDRDDPETRTGRRILGWSFVVGAALGAAVGIPRYGPFSMSAVALVGLGIITVIAVSAAVIAVLPARPPPPDAP